MWLSVLKDLGTVFGLGGAGQSVINNVGGVVTHAAAIPALIYFVSHANDQVQLGSVSLGFLGVCTAVGYLLLETMRRN
jgi:hypothetical protein